MNPSLLLGSAIAFLGFVLPISIAATNLLLSAVTILLLWIYFKKNLPWTALAHPFVYVFVIYCVAALISSWLGVNPGRSFQFFYKDFHHLWVVVLLLLALNIDPCPSAWKPLAAGFLLVIAAGLTQVFIDWQPYHHLSRIHGFIHPVTYGEIILIAFLGGICLLTGVLGKTPNSRRRWVLAFLLLSGLALIFNQTRSCLFALLFGLMSISWSRKTLLQATLWGIALTPAVLALWDLLFSGNRSFFDLLTPGGTATTAPAARYVLWKTALRIFHDHPWTGVGPANYRTVFSSYYPLALEEETNWGSAHNLYLHQLAERGLLGLTALILTLGVLIRNSLQQALKNPDPPRLWSLAVLTAFLIMNMTEVAFQNEQFMSLILFICCWTHLAPRTAS